LAGDERVDHPSHYNDLPAKCAQCGHQIECIAVVGEMNFNLGCAVKYLWRVGAKGDPIEDLKKAAKYIEFEIDRRARLARG
jgi:hypothetical protein